MKTRETIERTYDILSQGRSKARPVEFRRPAGERVIASKVWNQSYTRADREVAYYTRAKIVSYSRQWLVAYSDGGGTEYRAVHGEIIAMPWEYCEDLFQGMKDKLRIVTLRDILVMGTVRGINAPQGSNFAVDVTGIEQYMTEGIITYDDRTPDELAKRITDTLREIRHK